MGKEKLIAAVVVVVFFGVIGYFFISAETAGTEIPDYVGGNTREVYEARLRLSRFRVTVAVSLRGIRMLMIASGGRTEPLTSMASHALCALT
jgi:hypothetical protein